MDLQTLNPKVFQMWGKQKDSGPTYFQPSTQEDIAEIERLVETKIPDDYRDFLLEYSTVVGVYAIGAYFFPCRFQHKSVIAGNFSLVPWAKLTINAIRAYCKPHPAFEGVSPRVSRELLPLTRDNNATLLIDLRPTASVTSISYPSSKRRFSVRLDMVGRISVMSPRILPTSSGSWELRMS